MATSDHRPKLRMKRAGSSCAAKNEQATAAIIGADAPSGQPVPIQNAQQIRMAIAGTGGRPQGKAAVAVTHGRGAGFGMKGEIEGRDVAVLSDRLGQRTTVAREVDELAQPRQQAGGDDPLPGGAIIEHRLPLRNHGADPLGRLPRADVAHDPLRQIVQKPLRLALPPQPLLAQRGQPVLKRSDHRQQHQHAQPDFAEADHGIAVRQPVIGEMG